MARKEDVRITISVSPEAAAKIAELAELLGWSQSKMGGQLLEQGIEDAEWVIRVIKKFRDGFDRVAEAWGRKKRKPGH